MSKKVGRNDACPCGSDRKYKKCHGVYVLNGNGEQTVGRPIVSEPPRRWNPYAELPQIESERRGAIEEIFADEFAFIDDCLALAAKQVEMLGKLRPSKVEDVAMRDLNCDSFEFLYEARRVVAENRPSVVFPLMRRAFESVSLSHLLMVKPALALKWSKGRAFSNGEVRKHLESAPMTESVIQLREFYGHFSQGTHPNRSHLPYLFLGEGNEFTLGAIPPIDPLILGEHVRRLMEISYWYVGVFLYSYHELLAEHIDTRFAEEFKKLTPRIKELRISLHEELLKLREEDTGDEQPESFGPSFFGSPTD